MSEQPKQAWSADDDHWWDEYFKKRDQKYGGGNAGLWESTKRGAAGLSSYATWGHAGPGKADETWELVEALRFAHSMAEIVGGKAVKGSRWSQGEAAGATTKQNPQIVLSPAPMRGDRKLPRDDARTVVAGEAIHETGHAIRTPGDLAERVRERLGLTYKDRFDHGKQATIDAAASLVEDAHVEATVLENYPGYISYLDEAWRFKMPDEEVAEHLAGAARDDRETAAHLLDTIQDRSRRYGAIPEAQHALEAKLAGDKRRYLEAAARILRRAHAPNLTVDRRVGLAADLTKLLVDGEVPPEDRLDLGDRTWKPDGDQKKALGEHAGELTGEGRVDTPGTRKESDLDRVIAAQVQGAIERDARKVVTEIVTATGNAQVTIGMIDLEPRAEQAGRAMHKIARYIPALGAKLKFRSVRPRRHIGAQLQGRMEDHRIAEFPIAVRTGRQPRAFSRTEILSAPRVGVIVLVDMSGSMAATTDSAEFGTIQRAEAARLATAMAYGALQKLKAQTDGDVDFAVFGHTTPFDTTHFGGNVGCVVFRIVGPRTPGPERIGAIGAYGGNYDGPALAAVADWGIKQWPDRERVILFINDGLPNGDNYGGSPAFDAIRDHCRWLRKKRDTEVITIYLGEGNPGRGHDGAVPHRDLAHMYGPEGTGYVVVKDLGLLPHTVGKVLGKVLQWQA